MIPCTVYPFDNNNSVRYEPSCPVIPVIRARLAPVRSLMPLRPARRSLFRTAMVGRGAPVR